MVGDNLDDMDTFHTPVLVDEIVDGLLLTKNANTIDATLGHGGHTEKILQESAPHGKVLAIDKDSGNIAIARKRVHAYADRIIFVHSSFDQLSHIVKEHTFAPDALVLDLGVSSLHLDDADRGFSFLHNGPLDMRLDPTTQQERAQDIISTSSEEGLATLFKKYGEEQFARSIARTIVKEREGKTLSTTHQLSECIARGIPPRVRAMRIKKHQNPATKVFQALRIAVNDELGQLERVLPQAVDVLKPLGGRLAVISFHSLEDRMVKNFFRDSANDCECPPDFPVCACSKNPELRILTKKPITPSENESKQNPRARSAKLRIAEAISL